VKGRVLRKYPVLVLLIATAGLAQSPQIAGQWFGLPLPSGLGDPHRAVVNVAAASPAPARVPPGEERFRDLEGARIKTDLAAIVGFSKQSRAEGNRVWGRVTGFPSAAATIAWAADQFRAAGLSGVAVQPYDASAPMWWARSWEVRLVGNPAFGAGSRGSPGSNDVILQTAVPTSGSQIAGGTISAPLVHVGAVTDPALPNVDVKGKVAVQHLTPAAGAYSERGRTTERARALTERGAVAILNVVEQTGNMHVRDFGNCGAPCFNIGTADGAFLEAAMKRASEAGSTNELRIELRLDAEMLTGLKGQNAIGIIPGRSGPGSPGRPGSPGSNDGENIIVNGPSNVVRMNPGLTAKTVLVLNLEHIAQLRIRSGAWNVESTEQPMNFGITNSAPFLIDAGQRGVERYGFNLNPTFSTSVAGDLGGYAPLGVPRVQAIHSGPMYHTSGDVLDTISVPGLERAARFYVSFVADVSKAPRTDIDPQKK
jgi:hypothetical protein